MKHLPTLLLALMLGASPGQAQLLRQTTTFQGRLEFNGEPASGLFDLAYRLFETPAGTDQAGPVRTNLAVTVNNGAFTTEIEIPEAAFDWAQQFLELEIRPAGGGVFQTLAPRLQITPVPAALVAETARTVAPSAVDAAGLGGNAVTTASLADGSVTAAKVPAGQLVKSLNGLTDNVTLAGSEYIELASANGVITVNLLPLPCAWFSQCYWALTGNAGAVAAPPQTVSAIIGTHKFLGTTDPNKLELRVNKWRALRVEPTTANDAPNLLGGYGLNFANANAVGITIGGGGASGEPNRVDIGSFGVAPRYVTIGGGADNEVVSSSYATVGGGRKNRVLFDPTTGRGHYETIAGGATNLIDISAYASIGGGNEHRISSHSDHATVSGGQGSQVVESRWGAIGGGAGHIQAFTPGGTIGGGFTNRMTPAGGLQVAYAPTIGGGQENWIFASSYAVIAGGYNNRVFTFSDGAAIGGGQQNLIGFLSTDTTIGGGNANTVENETPLATISGGQNNLIRTTSSAATIGGGRGHTIEANSPAATISGGQGHIIEANTEGATIGGGRRHFIDIGADGSTISGGDSNHVGLLSGNSTIGGGQGNLIRDFNNLITIGGGGGNEVNSEILAATIAGGGANFIGKSSDYGAIGGGVGNQIGPISPQSTIAGGGDNGINFGPWSRNNTIGGGSENTIQGTAGFAVIPGGLQAVASRHGQVAHASGRFANNGDAQTSTHVLRTNTTDAITKELFLDGDSLRLNIPAGSTWTFDVQVAGRTQGGDSAGYKFAGVIENQGGTTSLIGLLDTALVREDVAAWNATVAADNANDALVIRVTGAAGATIRWVATVRTTEVMFP